MENKELNDLIVPDGIIIIDSDFQIIVFNEAAERITGFVTSEIAINFLDLFPSKKKQEYTNLFRLALNNGDTFSNLSLDIMAKNKTSKNVLSSITPVKKGRDSIVGVIFTFRDTQEMIYLSESLIKRTSELIDEKNKLEAIFNSNIEGTFTIDNDWNITSFNNSAVRLTGYKKEEAVGKKCWDIFKSDICCNNCHMEVTMAKGKATIGNELNIKHKNSKMIPIRVNSGILLNNKNEKIGAVETFIDISEIKNLNEHIARKFNFGNIIGNSKEMEKIYYLFESVSKTDSSVLLTGESGTGKELAARAIHLSGVRKNKPFIAVNCSAFNESLIESELFGHEAGAFTGAIKTKIGKFELAQGGTLFLDEFGDISSGVQIKLLRVLETKQFERVGGNITIDADVRIIAATNKDLTKEIANGHFREDLYYRINIINIHLPPLRDKLSDMPLLIDHFIKKFNIQFSKKINGISQEVFEIFSKYRWTGNIRELENVIEHSFILCNQKIINISHIPSYLIKTDQTTHNTFLDSPIGNAEKEIILNCLNRNQWNKKKTAFDLKIDTSTLWRKIKKYNIS